MPINAYVQATADPRSRARLEDLSGQINEWTEAIETMARRIDTYQQNEVISRDLASVPKSIEKLESQLATLQHLESTLVSMGTIYSQLLTSQSAYHVADYSRLSEDINEEVSTSQDHLEALEEVKLGRNY